MKPVSKMNVSMWIGLRQMALISLPVTLIALMGFGMRGGRTTGHLPQPSGIRVKKDSLASVRAFRQVYAVLMDARCMNCHPAGNIPLQGDDSHLHTMSPQRGTDGRGVFAMKCANCHQPSNSPGIHTPPGAPGWRLPPAGMPMVFQGRTAHQLARQLADRKQNGNKDLRMLIAHADDGLVLAAWHPGEGRRLPPMSHAAFKKAWVTWLTTGAFAP